MAATEIATCTTTFPKTYELPPEEKSLAIFPATRGHESPSEESDSEVESDSTYYDEDIVCVDHELPSEESDSEVESDSTYYDEDIVYVNHEFPCVVYGSSSSSESSDDPEVTDLNEALSSFQLDERKKENPKPKKKKKKKKEKKYVFDICTTPGWQLYISQAEESEGFHVSSFPDLIDVNGLVTPVKRLDNKYITYYTDFAISRGRSQEDEENQQPKRNLVLEKIVRANKQICCPCNYFITFEAKDMDDGGRVKTFQTKVISQLVEEDSFVEIFREKPPARRASY